MDTFLPELVTATFRVATTPRGWIQLLGRCTASSLSRTCKVMHRLLNRTLYRDSILAPPLGPFQVDALNRTLKASQDLSEACVGMHVNPFHEVSHEDFVAPLSWSRIRQQGYLSVIVYLGMEFYDHSIAVSVLSRSERLRSDSVAMTVKRYRARTYNDADEQEGELVSHGSSTSSMNYDGDVSEEDTDLPPPSQVDDEEEEKYEDVLWYWEFEHRVSHERSFDEDVRSIFQSLYRYWCFWKEEESAESEEKGVTHGPLPRLALFFVGIGVQSVCLLPRFVPYFTFMVGLGPLVSKEMVDRLLQPDKPFPGKAVLSDLIFSSSGQRVVIESSDNEAAESVS